MKQVSNATDFFVISSPVSASILNRKTFFKYPLLLLLLGLSVVLTSFKQGNLQSTLQSERHLKPCVPFKGKFTLTIDFSTGVVVGSGTATHIGKFDALAQDDLSAFPFITSTETFTAANGDEIWITQTGLAQDIGSGMLQGDFDATIVGGTGRFEGATGNYQLRVIVNAAQGTGSATFSGTINY